MATGISMTEKRKTSLFWRGVGLAVLLVSLSGCHSLFGSSDDDVKPQGKRIAVLDNSHKPIVDRGLDSFRVELPVATHDADWPQAGGNLDHAMPNPALSAALKPFWHADIGHGSDSDFRLLALPVVAAGKVFTIDSRGRVSAFSVKDGDRLWHFDTTPAERDCCAMGGGVAFSDSVLYVTTGYGEVLALRGTDGKVLWRKMLEVPVRAAPTIAGDRVLVLRIDNELDALSSQNGQLLWKHNGISENATLMGASAPAVEGDQVVVTYSSGEIFGLRAQTGRPAWSDMLASAAQVGALPSIADIRGLPVIDHNTVYAISHSDRMAAIDMRTGDRAWEVDIGGTNTPALAGNAVFVVTNDNQLMALTRATGRIAWIANLPKLKDPSDKDSDPVFWYGPLLAGDRLWLTNSLGHLVSFTPDRGDKMVDLEIADHFFLPPIAAGGVLYVVADDGTLYALK